MCVKVIIMMQLNTTTMKNFRNSLALWHIADFVIADEVMQKNARVKSYQTLIASNTAMIEKIHKGEKSVLKSEKELSAEIDKWESAINAENESIKKFRTEQEKDLKKGYDLVSKELMDAIREYMGNIYDVTKSAELVSALVKWFTDNGAKDADEESVMPYIKALGLKKASARQKCANGTHNAVQSDKAIRDIFLGAICDEPNMKKVLPIHKFVTIIEKKSK